jgi:hypothetical protein
MRIDWQYDLYVDEAIWDSATVGVAAPSVGPASYELFNGEGYQDETSVGGAAPPAAGTAEWLLFAEGLYEDALSFGPVTIPPVVESTVASGGWVNYTYNRHKKRIEKDDEDIMAVITAFLHTRRH